MPQPQDPKLDPASPEAEAATHPEAGSGLKPAEARSFDPQSGTEHASHVDRGQGAALVEAAEEAEIAADDAGASAAAETAQKKAEGLENDG